MKKLILLIVFFTQSSMAIGSEQLSSEEISAIELRHKLEKFDKAHDKLFEDMRLKMVGVSIVTGCVKAAHPSIIFPVILAIVVSDVCFDIYKFAYHDPYNRKNLIAKYERKEQIYEI
jgi:hypothetical protein